MLCTACGAENHESALNCMACSTALVQSPPVAGSNAHLAYPNEKPLFVISAVISILVWIAVTVGTFGAALLYVLLFFVAYLFAQSAFIAHIKGTAVRISPEQFPDLHQRVQDCASRLGMTRIPEAYLLHGNGVFNAFATRFLGRSFMVLLSDVVDALENEPEALNFYIGHELGHLACKHLVWGPVLAPAGVLPLLGSAYSRARESTCDRFGHYCCTNPDVAARGLAALAAGEKRWQSLNLRDYAAQSRETGGFWMSFHELTADYPWLVKRLQRIDPAPGVTVPRRHAMAWLLALFVPRFGRGGSQSLLITVAIIGILAAVAIPAYQDYMAKSRVNVAVAAGREASNKVTGYILQQGHLPSSLEEAGFKPASSARNLEKFSLDAQRGVIRITFVAAPLQGQSIFFVPSLDKSRHIHWRCGSPGIKLAVLPAGCRNRFGDKH